MKSWNYNSSPITLTAIPTSIRPAWLSKGGCRWIQLRMKDASEAEITREALRILPLCREHGATFIIDDHVEIVRKTGADGVHLAKTTCP